MTWVKMVLDFVVDIIHYAAWPTVVIFTLIFFSKPLEKLLNRIRKLKHKDSSIDFTALPTEVKKAVGDKEIFDVTRENLNYDKYLDTIEGLGIVIAIFASRVRKFDKEWTLLELGDKVLEQTADKIKAERSTSIFLKFMHTGLEDVLPKDERKQ